MKTTFFKSLLFALLLSLFSVSIALAHGQPTIIVEPAIASPGGQITITGADMEEGEMFEITLENTTGTIQLGEATAVKKDNEAGFTAVFPVPNDLAAGLYLLRATTDKDETVATDLTIATSADQTNSASMEASDMQHTLDRSKPPLLIGSVIALALLSTLLGVWLIRMREH